MVALHAGVTTDSVVLALDEGSRRREALVWPPNKNCLASKKLAEAEGVSPVRRVIEKW